MWGLNDVVCRGEETSLADCSHSSSQSCLRGQVAGVLCVGTKSAVTPPASSPASPPASSPGSKPVASVVISSTGAAAEYPGNTLGQYVEGGRSGGRIFFIQKDTTGSKQYYLYYQPEDKAWYVNAEVGWVGGGYLRNSDTSQQPPRTGWEWRVEGEWSADDPSLEVVPGVVRPCGVVTVRGEGEVERKGGEYLGEYLATEDWSEGRPVYMMDGEKRYLLVKEGTTNWFVSNTVDGTTSYLLSGRATVSPGHPEAGPSKRWGYAGWRYNVGLQWVDGHITVTCD